MSPGPGNRSEWRHRYLKQWGQARLACLSAPVPNIIIRLYGQDYTGRHIYFKLVPHIRPSLIIRTLDF